jgi:hypothetical protein
MTNGQSNVLARHLSRLWGKHPSMGEAWLQADSILADPQAHFDALVEAGAAVKCVGCRWPDGTLVPTVYRVVQPEPPHEHTWRVRETSGPRAVVVVLACECGYTTRVPNELPIRDPFA